MAFPNVVDMRIYTIKPQGMPAFLKMFEEHGLPIQLKYLGKPVGWYTTEVGPLNQIVHMWGYDSLADMEAKRNARNADPAWRAYSAMTEGFITAQETRILRGVNFKAVG